jgi:3-hydroxyacyl-CoA dehydrogenase
MTKEDYEKKLSLLSGVLDYEQFRDADVVIEVDTVLYCFYGFVQ